jgi:hypothetical protein
MIILTYHNSFLKHEKELQPPINPALDFGSTLFEITKCCIFPDTYYQIKPAENFNQSPKPQH